MRNTMVVLAWLTLTGCIPFSDNESSVSQKVDYFCKIEGSAIGHEGFVLRLGDRAVRFQDWVEKAGTNNEYVGFSLSYSGATSMSYIVKASTVSYPSSSKTWTHPVGADANAISNVDFCGECEDGSCGGGGGGDEGGGGGGDGGEECDCDPETCSGPLY